MIDLRSDTVTSPTDEMREAMSSALVGDDGYGEDPTVRELEERFARRVGKESAIFVPSGTMANQIAIRVLTKPGDVVVAGARQHVVIYEEGAAARNSSLQFRTLNDHRGTLSLEDIQRSLETANHHQQEISAVFVENTHMPSGGRVWQPGELATLKEAIGDRPLHVDGARLFNAEVATGIPAAEIVAPATTVMCCLSKGLCAPVGSLLAGPESLTGQMRVERKRLGGSMRQAGVVAAPGIIGLTSMVERLAEDHQRAHRIAEAVAQRWPEVAEEVLTQPTNLVVFKHLQADGLLEYLSAQGIIAGTISPGIVRLVTHREIDDDATDRVAAVIKGAP
jgi:threonine aldolase